MHVSFPYYSCPNFACNTFWKHKDKIQSSVSLCGFGSFKWQIPFDIKTLSVTYMDIAYVELCFVSWMWVYLERQSVSDASQLLASWPGWCIDKVVYAVSGASLGTGSNIFWQNRVKLSKHASPVGQCPDLRAGVVLKLSLTLYFRRCILGRSFRTLLPCTQHHFHWFLSW